MPIAVECSQCGRKYRVGDERAGQTFDCKECGEEVEIPGGRRRSRDQQESSGRRRTGKKKSSGGNSSMILIGLGAGAAVVVVCLVAAMLLMRKPADPAANPGGDPIANSTTPPNGTPNAPSAIPNPVTPSPAQPPMNTQPVPNPAAPPANQAPNNGGIAKAAGSGFKGGGDQGGAGAKFALKSPQNWKAQPDPGPAAQPADSPKFNIKLKDGFIDDNSVIYPETPSRFGLIGEGDSKTGREVWNLGTGTKAGALKAQRITGTTIALSPDGKYVGWFKFDNGGVVEVWDVAGKKSLGGVSVDSGKFNMAVLAIPTPTRMVALSDVNHGLLSWKLPSGDLERELNLGDKARPGDRYAFSPGGRYVAVLRDFLAKSISIYDFDAGEIAGEIEFEKGPTNELLGMAFSHDGQQFAAVFEGDSPSYGEHLMIWKTATGTVAETIVLDEGVKKQHSLHGKGTSLQWFPNGKQLLLHGVAIVDRDAKKVVYNLSKPKFDSGSLRNRRVIDNGLIAACDGTRQDASVQPLFVKAEDIARSVEAVEAGGLLVDAKLPKLTKFDASAAQDKSDDNAAGWQVSADPVPAGRLLEKPLALKGTGKPRGLSVSRQDAGLGFVRFAEGEDATDLKSKAPEVRFRAARNATVITQSRPKEIHCQKNWIEVLDLAKGESKRRLDIGFSCDLLAASGDGKRVLVAPHDGQGRVDVYSADDGTHLAACRPFQEEAKEQDRDLQAAFFIDSNHVAVMNFEDRVIVFSLPDCQPVYELKEIISPRVSPGGKYLAVGRDKRVELRDGITGAPKGSVDLGGPVRALAFHPGGERLAVVTTENQGWYLTEIGMDGNANGQPVPIPISVQTCQWCGDNYLLLNNTALFDLKQKTVAWTYELLNPDESYVALPPDTRVWISAKGAKSNAVQIAAIELPGPAATAKLAGAVLEPKLLVKPGGSVTVMAKIAERPDRNGFQTEAMGVLAKAVERSGVKDAPGQPVKLAVSTELKSLGKADVKFFGNGANQQVQLDHKGVEITVAYDYNGVALWKTSTMVTNLGFLVRVPSVENAQRAIDDQMWDRARGFFDSVQLPAYVFSPESVYGLGTSTITSDGAQPKK